MLLKGKPAADALIEKLSAYGTSPLRLAVFHPAGDASAESYLKAKQKALARLNFTMELVSLTKDASADAFFTALDKANRDPGIHGIMVELPLPGGIPAHEVNLRIDPKKDVDGVSYHTQGLLYATREERIVPCTALGAVLLLEHYQVPLAGRQVLVVGRSNIVGMPLFKLLLNRDATVTVAHSRTPGLSGLVGRFDVIAVATGKAGLVRSVDVHDGAAVVDIGINVGPDGNLCGDFAPQDDKEADRIHYSPVPGGAGVVTNAVMLRNLIECHRMQQGR